MAKSISLTITSLHSKVEKLIILNKKNGDDVKRFKEENEALRDELKQSTKKKLELEEKVKILSLAKSLSNDEIGKNELKLKINELVREIDKCIALTNG
jgi:predicted RNase H-like nuclease (RuvC/YqgF family)